MIRAAKTVMSWIVTEQSFPHLASSSSLNRMWRPEQETAAYSASQRREKPQGGVTMGMEFDGKG